PAQVQGETAPSEVSSGVRYFNRRGDVDVIIVARGGGSFEDLFAFNDEGLARVVASSTIPVISAVGHEIDFTICDFVADLRAPTPSAAAELVVHNKSELESNLQSCLESLMRSMENQVENLREQVDNSISSPVFTQPTKTLEAYSQRVDDFSDRL